MENIPGLRRNLEIPKEILKAGINGDLILFVGAGVSMLVGYPSWAELSKAVLMDLRDQGLLNYSDVDQLLCLDPRKQLSIAHQIAEAKDKDIIYEKHLSGKAEGNSIYKSINDIGCSCVTTNYDELLAPRYSETSDGSSTHKPVVRVVNKEEIYPKHLDEPGTVVHLHGSISNPASMVVTTRNYLEHYDDKNVQSFLGQLFEKKVVLFVGYGLEEAEILEHILRRGSARRADGFQGRRFILQGFFYSQVPLYERLTKYYESTFGVRLLGFSRDQEDYKQLEKIITTWANQIIIKKPPLATLFENMNEVLDGK